MLDSAHPSNPPRTLRRLSVVFSALLLLQVAGAAWGDDDLSSLELYNGPDTEIIAGSRSPRPASQTAENITVVTAKEIESINAHTLNDVLHSVTGVQVEMNRTPGTISNFHVQGANFNHVLVLVDGIPINNLADNFPDISSIPVQMIERIEIVKGAASSSWGSALGGVINVITKAPQTESPFAATASASAGTRETLDGRVEASGTLDSFGYYLTAGKLRSDGLLSNNHADLGSLYTTLRYELPTDGDITLRTGFADSESGQVATRTYHADTENRQLLTSLTLHCPLAYRLVMDFSVQSRRSTTKASIMDPTETRLYLSKRDKERSYGGTFKLSWLGDVHRIAAGVDYDHVKADLDFQVMQADWRADRFGFYLIDTITLGRFAITPSARFDKTGSGGDHLSPSLGVTYALTENTVLRAYTAKGYSLTSLNRADSTEKVWTSQLGFETGELPYLWFKTTFFRNDTSNIEAPPPSKSKLRQLKEGVEVEAKTLPVFNTSLSLGYTFIRATDTESDRIIAGVPRHGVNVGLKYDDPAILQAELTGTLIDWNNADDSRTGSGLWDLHVRKWLASTDTLGVELFFSLRNIFDGRQYLDDQYRNAGRWAEAGVRCKF